MTTQSQPGLPPASYADVFDLTLSPYGASFRFGSKGPVVPGPNQTMTQQVELNARISMSLEHLKAMAFVIAREVLRHEKALNVVIPLPAETIGSLLYPPPPMPPEAQAGYLKSMQPLALKEWEEFWQGRVNLPQTGSPNGAIEDPAKALTKA